MFYEIRALAHIIRNPWLLVPAAILVTLLMLIAIPAFLPPGNPFPSPSEVKFVEITTNPDGDNMSRTQVETGRYAEFHRLFQKPERSRFMSAGNDLEAIIWIHMNDGDTRRIEVSPWGQFKTEKGTYVSSQLDGPGKTDEVIRRMMGK